MKDPDAKFKLIKGYKRKPEEPVAKMTESLPLRCQAIDFASSLLVKKPFIVNKKVEYNIKRTFQKAKRNLQLKKALIGTPHFSRPCTALKKKDSFQKCKAANPNEIQIRVLNKRAFFGKKKTVLQNKNLQVR